ncbi:MAG TPA: hypothetical protein VEF35_08415 [Candidatus Bathyarchaeia archaeon]|nr:hypothetical protein [Candidatus Bathyarchaeia archaeon]
MTAQDDPEEKASVNDSETTRSANKNGDLWQEPLCSKCIVHFTVVYKKQNLARYDFGILVVNDFKFADGWSNTSLST